MNKTRLIKKNEVTQPNVTTAPENQELIEKRNQFITTHKAMQATKEWLVSRRQEQGRARETFAGLFACHDPQSA
jgi:hypothetical protein